MLAVLAAAVGFLMLLVSANISNLLLARASARHKEMALRMALGAGRERLVRQLLVESLALSCGGATLGLAFAVGGTILIANLEGASIPLLRDVRVDGLVMAFVASVAMLTGICFGVLPALQASGSAPQDALKGSGRGATGGGGWMRRAIVVTEIALVSVLLTGAGLLTRSLSRVLDVDPGFTSENVISLRVDPSRLEHPTLRRETPISMRSFNTFARCQGRNRWPDRRAAARRQLRLARMDRLSHRSRESILTRARTRSFG